MATTDLNNSDIKIKQHLMISFIVVDRPEKILAKLDTYIAFHVVSEVDHRKITVQRRYNDFVWLKHRLETRYPFHIIPPLPEKHSVYSLERFDPEFIRYRTQGLNLFMKWLAKSGLATDDADLFNFLTLDDQDSWLCCKKSKTVPENHQKNANLPQNISIKETDTENLASFSNYCNELSQTLGAVSRMAFRFIKSFTELYKDLESFSTVLSHWRETELDGALKPGVESFSETIVSIVDVLSGFAKNIESNFAIPTQLMSAYCDVAKQAIKVQAQIRGDKIHLEQFLAKKSICNGASSAGSSRSSVVSENGSSSSQRLHFPTIESRLSDLNFSIKSCDATLPLQISNWNRTKNQEILSLLESTSLEFAQIWTKVSNAWEETIRKIRNEKESLP